MTIPISSEGYWLENYLVKYPKGTNTDYIFTSSNTDLLELAEDTLEGTLISKNYGTAKIKIEEINLTTKKKTYIGTTTVEISPSYLNPKFKYSYLEYKEPTTLLSLISSHFQLDRNWDPDYSCTIEDSSVVSVTKEKVKAPETWVTSTYYSLTGLKNGGETKITVYEEYKGKKTEIGSFTVIVNETVDEFKFIDSVVGL